MKKIISFLFICVLAFLVVGCDLGGNSNQQVKYSLTISEADKNVSLEIGDTKQIGVIFEGGTLEWLSSDDSVVSVTNGLLTALKVGTATITVQLKENAEYKATISVTIKEKEPVVVKHSVIFIDSETGEVLSEQSVVDGEAAIAPTVDNPGFAGWDKEFNEVKEDMIIMTIIEEVVTSKISYILSGGAWEKPEDKISTYVEGTEVELKTPVREGYDFLGWTFVKNGTEYTKVIPENKKGDITLYANWKEKLVEVTFNFGGGASNEMLLALKDLADAALYVDNYNYNGGAFWSNENYRTYVFVGQRTSDPGATFSDRIYFAKDTESGLYKIMHILPNGSSSSWANGAEWVLTVSSSYKSFN